MLRLRVLVVSAIVACGFLVSRHAVSQSSEGSWISLDGSKPGTPIEITLDPRSSNASISVFTVVVHGFWAEVKSGPGGPYTKVSVPGMATTEHQGAPSLPVLRLDLAVPASDAAATLRSAKVSDSKTYGKVFIWPNPIPELDHEQGTPEVCDRQQAFERPSITGTTRAGRGRTNMRSSWAT